MRHGLRFAALGYDAWLFSQQTVRYISTTMVSCLHAFGIWWLGRGRREFSEDQQQVSLTISNPAVLDPLPVALENCPSSAGTRFCSVDLQCPLQQPGVLRMRAFTQAHATSACAPQYLVPPHQDGDYPLVNSPTACGSRGPGVVLSIYV
jgi:hypothetical protein